MPSHMRLYSERRLTIVLDESGFRAHFFRFLFFLFYVRLQFISHYLNDTLLDPVKGSVGFFFIVSPPPPLTNIHYRYASVCGCPLVFTHRSTGLQHYPNPETSVAIKRYTRPRSGDLT